MKRSDSAMARRVDDQIVILDIPSGEYFGINDVGALIWDRLETDATSADLVDVVVAVYDVDRAVVEADVAELITQLRTAGLVTG